MELHRDTAESGLVILAFPCNQFKGQEPGSNEDIRAFAEARGVPRQGGPEVGFIMMEKVDVNGPDSHNVYKFLKAAASDSSDVKWNFASYWLVDRQGEVKLLPGLQQSPASHKAKIADALAA